MILVLAFLYYTFCTYCIFKIFKILVEENRSFTKELQRREAQIERIRRETIPWLKERELERHLSKGG